MATQESFTYNDYVVGGAAPTSNTQVHGRFGWTFDAKDGSETATFICDFIITGSSVADLNSKCTTMVAALSAKYQDLNVKWSSSNVMDYTSSKDNPTGWDAEPQVDINRTVVSTGLTRGFTFRCVLKIPPNYTDTAMADYGGLEAGRRTSKVALEWDTENRRRVTIEGLFTEVASMYPRQQTTTNQVNHPDTTKPIDAYCLARLAIIDSGPQWTLCSRWEQDNNTQREMTFRRIYCETVAGRLSSTIQIRYRGSRFRDVVVRGVYVRTYGTGTTTVDARTSYTDAGTGGYADAVTKLAAIATDEGGPLTVGTDCEMVSEVIDPRETSDRLEYTLVFRELAFKQSNQASGLDDPEIINDRITMVLDFEPLNDSEAPVAGKASGPNPFNPTPGAGGGGGGKPAGTQVPQTLERTPVQPKQAGGTTQEKGASALAPSKPIHLRIRYVAEIDQTVVDLRGKWENDIKPWLIQSWASELGFGPAYEAEDRYEPELQGNTITAQVHAIALPGDLLGYLRTDAVQDQLGLETDEALSGTEYEYLIQSVFPERRVRRTHRAVFKTGGSFDPTILATETAIPGYLVLARSAPEIMTKLVGIPNRGIPTQKLTYIQFQEDLLYVAKAADGSTFQGTPNGAPSASSQNKPVQPKNPGGV